METRASKRQKKLRRNKSNEVSAAGDGDRISNLPSEIVHHIFSYLPLKDVVRTSVLSKQWRHLWYAYPCFDFTTLCSFDFFGEWYSSQRKRPEPLGRPDSINHVVRLLGKHPDVKILKFLGPVRVYSALERLMKKAVAKNVQVLDIVFSTRCRKPFTLPSCVVNSTSLRDLRLGSPDDCPGSALPPLEVMKNGFKSLGSLSLSIVSFSDQPSVLNLFTNSLFPSLTKLHLESCRGLKCLRILISGLRDFSLRACSEIRELDISAEKLNKLRVVRCPTVSAANIITPSLETIIWMYTPITEDCVFGKFDSLKDAVLGVCGNKYSDSKMPSIISNVLTQISQCQCLTLVGLFFSEILSRLSHLGVELPVFEKLKSLELKTDSGRHHIPGLASLFRSSPFVHEMVFISMAIDHHYLRPQLWHENDQLEAYWDSRAQSLDSFLGHLRHVKIVGFKELTNEVNLVKFLLKHGKVLRRLTLSRDVTVPIPREAIIKSQIMVLPRASSDVQIVFERPLPLYYYDCKYYR